jgi:hypothetical protein
MRTQNDAQKEPRPVLYWLTLPVATLLFASAALHPTSVSASPSGPAQANPPAKDLSSEEAQAMVKRVLQAELTAVEDTSHPMQYRLRKSSPRLATTKLLVESRDGDVARLLAINDTPLNAQDAQNEQARLQTLLKEPEMQRKRKEREQADSERAKKIMRALPYAFNYAFAGFTQTPEGPSYRFTFQPNPKFDPQDLEAQVLKGMAGELWIDVAQQRVTRLEGKRLYDVNYGLGILGKLDQGGTLLLEQADIGDHQWRTTHMVLIMNARVLFKTVKLDTTLELSSYVPVATALSYQQAIQILEQSNPTQTK